MERSKKIVLLAHCLLNINSKVVGLAYSEAGSVTLVTELMKHGYGIIQLPCVEQFVCGCQRWGQVKEQLSHPHYRQSCRQLLQPVLQQIQDFTATGYHIAGIIGIDGSPSCGVNITCSGKWGGELASLLSLPEKLVTLLPTHEKGVMMEELQKMLLDCNLTIPFLAVEEEKQQENSVAHIINALKI
jgi:predicted secreted protein